MVIRRGRIGVLVLAAALCALTLGFGVVESSGDRASARYRASADVPAEVRFPGLSSPRDHPRNLILISVDTLHRSALRAYDPRARALPALDALARRSLVFTNAYAAASWTLPSQASLHTGLYPDGHGATHQNRKISGEVRTLAEVLQAVGYRTLGFTDGGFTASEFGFGRGFERYLGSIFGDLEHDAKGRPVASQTFQRASDFLRSNAGSERRFFLFLHTYSVHHYFGLQPWAVERLAGRPLKDRQAYLDYVQGRQAGDPRDWETLEDLYEAELVELDSRVGALLSALDDSGAWSSTLVVFTSDHGEGFEPGRARTHHGGRLNEDLIRVPFLVAGAGVVPGVTHEPLSLVDLLPTALDVLDVEGGGDVDGRSLAAVLQDGPGPGVRPLYAMEHMYRWGEAGRMVEEPPPTQPLAIAAIEGERWYVRSGSGEELYDMRRDPGQTRNLAASTPDLEHMRALAQERGQSRPGGGTHELSASVREELRALGYLRERGWEVRDAFPASDDEASNPEGV